VSSAVSRTSWQAQKQLRVRSKQTEIDKLFEQRQQLLDELAGVAMNLYQQNKLTDSQLSRLCASIQELDHDMQNREMQLQEVKSEMYPAAQLAPAPTTNYAPPPAYASPSQGAAQPSGAGPQPRPQSQSQPQICPNCGNPVRPNALYCRTCGAKLR
jgi:hypothetical protein